MERETVARAKYYFLFIQRTTRDQSVCVRIHRSVWKYKHIYVFLDAVAAYLSQTTTVHLGFRYTQTHRVESRGSERIVYELVLFDAFCPWCVISTPSSTAAATAAPIKQLGKCFRLFSGLCSLHTFRSRVRASVVASFRFIFFLLCSCSLHFKSNTKYRMETEIRSRSSRVV